jgi:uncharacterized RDD family membrane protein YckC
MSWQQPPGGYSNPGGYGPNPYAQPGGGGFNPYAPPQDHNYQPYPQYGGGWDQPLATRGARFGARLIDGLLTMVVAAPGFIYLMSGFEDSARAGSSAMEEMIFVALGIIGLPILALSVYQWIGIAKRGQTLGKKWLNIRVVKHDGSPVDFVSGVILREWVQAVINNLPYIGSILALVDSCMIFATDQQCMHDKIAKTKVIAVIPGAEAEGMYGM